MSQYQQPYAPPPAQRKPPRKIWWFVASGLLLLAPIVFLASLFTTLSPMTREDARFTTNGASQVELPAGEERAIFVEGSDMVDCTVTDGAGNPIELRPVMGEFTVNEWRAVHRFDTGDGRVTFECSSPSPNSQTRIAQLPSTGGFVAGIIIGIIAPMFLGGAGILMLIILAIRRNASRAAGPSGPTGPAWG